MTNPEFSEAKFRESINQAPNQWGQAHLTEAEWRSICQSKGDKRWSGVYGELARGEIPPPIETDEFGFIELATQDACPVAYSLYLSPDRTLESLVWSYTMKGRAFRSIAWEIKDEELKRNWRGSETKEEGEVGVLGLMRPEGIPSDVLVGKEKLACYFPCQLLKELEAIRTGRSELLDPISREPIILDDDEREFLRIPWGMYREAIHESDCIEDIAVNIAVETFRVLNERGLDEDKIQALLFQGYRPHGPLLEYGQKDKIIKIWGLIAAQLDGNHDIHLWQKMMTVINDAIDEYNEKANDLGRPLLRFYIKL